jgi:hypothetical protein
MNVASCAPQTPFDVRRRVSFDGLTGRVLGYRAIMVLWFFIDYVRREGKEPSYSQICDGTGVGTKGEVSQIMRSLEVRGLMRRPGCGGPINERRARLTANL